jgi:hypothetical protein
VVSALISTHNELRAGLLCVTVSYYYYSTCSVCPPIGEGSLGLDVRPPLRRGEQDSLTEGSWREATVREGGWEGVVPTLGAARFPAHTTLSSPPSQPTVLIEPARAGWTIPITRRGPGERIEWVQPHDRPLACLGYAAPSRP